WSPRPCAPPPAKYHHCTSPNCRYGVIPAALISAAVSAYTCCQKARLAGPKFVCSAGVPSSHGVPSGYRCAIPAASDPSPFPSSMLNAAAAGIPYPFSAPRKLAVQSRHARFRRGVAATSVIHLPSMPPAKSPLTVAVNCVLPPVSAVSPSPFPLAPAVRAVIVKTGPSARSHAADEPALISSAKHCAMLAAVSVIRLTCSIQDSPTVTVVVTECP